MLPDRWNPVTLPKDQAWFVYTVICTTVVSIFLLATLAMGTRYFRRKTVPNPSYYDFSSSDHVFFRPKIHGSVPFSMYFPKKFDNSPSCQSAFRRLSNNMAPRSLWTGYVTSMSLVCGLIGNFLRHVVRCIARDGESRVSKFEMEKSFSERSVLNLGEANFDCPSLLVPYTLIPRVCGVKDKIIF